jgi:polyhydroxyalkanoate synthesis regulator phasin
MSTQAQAAFSGVGDGLTEIFGQMDDFGRNLGLVIANNIGGSISDLRILLQSTGKTVDELRDALVKAADDGKLSFNEFATDMAGLNKVAEAGMPEIIGATAEELKRLQEAGTSGGRVSIDALKGLFAEAREVGKNSLDQIAADLKAKAPESMASIDALVKSLQAHGLDTLEKVNAASNATLYQVLSDAEAQGMAFDKTAQDIDGLIAQVDKLKNMDDIRKKVTIDVEVNDPNNALDKIGAPVSPSVGQSQGTPPQQ